MCNKYYNYLPTRVAIALNILLRSTVIFFYIFTEQQVRNSNFIPLIIKNITVLRNSIFSAIATRVGK
jgi:ABC-type enterochelin transport system permease subunit